MEIITEIVLAFTLSIDSFSILTGSSIHWKKLNPLKIIIISSYFGLFHFFILFIGWYSTSLLTNFLSSIDHWIAISILIFIATKMIIESFNKNKNIKTIPSHKILFILAFSTSIDAFGIGFSYSIIQKPIIFLSITTGVIVFLMCIIAINLGRYLYKIFQNKIEFIGGIVLILIAIKIAIDHNVI